ncbi:MAG TPA: hypothetical protein VLZ84_07260 [Asticcacaulis sp.]|nr:hypothetical protein [Asticcacaulis sp.]
MPLDLKPLPHADAKLAEESQLTTEARLAHFVQSELNRALHVIDHRKRTAETDLDHCARRAAKRMISSAHRLERSLRRNKNPLLPVAIGLTLIGAAWLLSNHRRN